MHDDTLINGFTGFSASAGNTGRYAKPVDDRTDPIPFSEEELASLEGQDRRWAWIEVDQSAIAHNTKAAKRALRPGCRLMAVVKADGYGHGAIECARTALNSGADSLAVATVDEALQIRKAGITCPLVILAEPPISSIPLLLANNIQPSVYSVEFALAYGETAFLHHMKAPFHLAVNTGMNRIGVKAEDVVEFLNQISFHCSLEQVGTFTHFATADCPETYDFEVQLRRFKDTIRAMKSARFDPGIVHSANSAAIFRYPQTHFDMARLGISLYGFPACDELKSVADLRPAMSVKARITAVKGVPVSEGVSYGMHYRSPGGVQICTVPLGYADGLRRELSGKVDFITSGHYVRQVGNICMDQCMFVVDHRRMSVIDRVDPQVGDVVTIIGRDGEASLTISDMAKQLGTIEHEVAIGFSHRMPRIQL